MIYGSETTTYSLPLVEDFDLTTDNNLAGAFLYAQWRPLSGAVQPYVEGRVGMNYLWTDSKLEDEDWWDDDDVARKTNYDDFARLLGRRRRPVAPPARGKSQERRPGGLPRHQGQPHPGRRGQVPHRRRRRTR